MRRELGPGVNAFLRLLGMSKGAYYRRKRKGHEDQEGVPGAKGSCQRPCPKREAIRDQARQVALTFPTYGYRKVWAELLRRGVVATESTVYRVLQGEGLLLPRKGGRRKDPGQGGEPEPPSPSGWAWCSAPTVPCGGWWRARGAQALGAIAFST
ncbi:MULTISPECIES: IS3 family transposase [unclassified Meiothermus]|uniref:IS3 family transposase n=1 Tax=unclassified Meiothermus TaxID=370471 RepID=UPI001314FE2B|nr:MULTISPECIES: IS3 family transposase [unclassified Meiothermus]